MLKLTRNDICNGLFKLGVREGMDLEVHSSLSSLGYVEGGALSVISALKEAVGQQGSIFMPALRLSKDLPLNAFDRANGLLRKIKVLSDKEPHSAMGIVADTFRLMPDTKVGTGTFAAAAWGKHAQKVNSMFQYLIEHNGKAVMIGVDIYSLTAMHQVENYLPAQITRIFKSPELDLIYDPNKWFVEDGEAPQKAWYKIQDMAMKNGFIKQSTIGNAKCMLIDLPETIGLYRKELIEHPFELYGLKPE